MRLRAAQCSSRHGLCSPTARLLAICEVLNCRPEDLLKAERTGPITEAARRASAHSRQAQGLPPQVEDPSALDEAAELLRRRA